jgi:ATP-binding cassette subfamily B protein
MSWIIALALICLLGSIAVLMAIAMPKFKAIQNLIDRLNLVSRESLSGMTVIRAFRTETHEKERFDRVNQDLTATLLFISRIMVVMMPMMILTMNGITLLVVWVGAHQIALSNLQIGDMIAFMQYAIQVVMAFLMMTMIFILLPRAAVSAQRVSEVLSTENTITDPTVPVAFDQTKGGLLEFKNVHFRYLGATADALHAVSFTALPGQTTAIIGSTGSGKSTVASLALRFYDVSQGQILVDGADIRHVRQRDLRAKIGFVPQKGILLSGTVTTNLRYGDSNATEAQLLEAATTAQIMDFIAASPQGLALEIARGGANVSGGQKQRLSIARALVKRPQIIIFDDSFSALDFKTDATLRRALKEHTAGLTVILIAQRVGTIMEADQIIVLHEGRIVGRGTHRELLHNCPPYYEIASSQLPKEELV